MRFASFCALAGTALLAGHLVIAEQSPDVETLNIEGLESLGAEGLNLKIDASEAMNVEDKMSPEVVDGLTLTDEEEAAIDSAEGQVFKAEVSRMMKLIINSIYKNKEIFLRELISNASDALDKIRLKLLTDRSTIDSDLELRVRIRADKANNVLHIEDTGMGMTKEELMKNLGTIAKSGTAEFMEAIEAGGSQDANSLIGQFGVGFYSAFLVADKVVVASKSDSDDQYLWTSDASSFSVIKDPRGNTLSRGTRISLYLKPEATEYLEPRSLNHLVSKYSEFIDFPIYSWKETEQVVEEDDADENAAAEDTDEDDNEGDDKELDEDEDEGDVEEDDGEESEEGEKTVLVWDYERMNPNRPIWTRDPKEVEPEEYTKFYKSFNRNDSDEPLAQSHFKVEGTEVGFRSILFVPSASNVAGSQQEQMATQLGKNIKFYVRRVFITEDLEDFIPRYLWFIKGIVDSDDWPLNVSRETLQNNKMLKVIKKKIVRKIIQMFKDLVESDEKKYLQFYASHASNIKLGVVEDSANRGRLAELLRFETTKSKDTPISLEKYVENMKEGQNKIYYVSGPSIEDCDNSPFIEQLKKNDFEVLYMVDPIDEYAIQNLPEFKEIKFSNVAKDPVTFDEETESNEARKAYFEELDTAYENTKDYFKETFSDLISKVSVSNRLDESPCVLVASQFGWSGNMQRIMESQPHGNGDSQMQFYASQKKTLEINPRHPLIKKLRALVDAGETMEQTNDLARVLLDTALIRSGYPIKDQVPFSARIERMLRVSMGVDVDETLEPLPEFAPNEVDEDEDEDEEEVDADADDEVHVHNDEL